MKYSLILSLAAFAPPALSQGQLASQAYIDQTSYVTNDGIVSSIDPATTFTVSHGGHFRGRLNYQSMKIDASTGLFVEPNLVGLWSVRNEDLENVGNSEWHGDDGNQTVLPSLSFNPQTGIGRAQVDIPMGQYIGQWSYPHLPEGGATLYFAFGPSNSLGLGSDGWPVNFSHYALYSFDTAYPDVLTYADKGQMAMGEAVQITVVMDEVVTSADVLQIDVIGDAKLQLKDGGPTNSWTLPIPADTRVYAIDLVARKTGTFFVRASLSNGAFGDGPWCQISGTQLTPAEGNSPAPTTGPGTMGYRSEEEKSCRPGVCAPTGGDKELNCTRPFIELVETPPNPDCVSNAAAIVIHGGCTSGESSCTFIPELLITCPRYAYAGTVDRSAGAVEVGGKVGLDGGVNWVILKAETSVEFHTSTMSPITRRCCKYTPVPGETAEVNVRSCQ